MRPTNQYMDLSYRMLKGSLKLIKEANKRNKVEEEKEEEEKEVEKKEDEESEKQEENLVSNDLNEVECEEEERLLQKKVD